MRDRVERFVVLPLSIGCNSESSIALGKDGNNQVKKPSHEEPKTARRRENTEEISSSSSSSSSSSAVVKKKKNAFISFLTLPKRNISGGIKRLIKSIKSFSQIFVYKEEGFEEPEKEMEIGFPTDVKHVTHIGLDGSTTTNPVKGIGMGMGMAWGNLNNPPEVLSFPTISLKQFELAMAAQSDLHHDNHQSPLVVDLNDIVKDNLKKA